MTRERRFVFTGKNAVELETFDPGTPGKGEIAVRTVMSMLSPGTEGIVYQRAFREGTHWDRWVRYPFYPGYSAAGFVEAVGEGVTKVRVGDRVITRGPHASCCIVPEEKCHRIPEGISFEDSLWFAFAKITAMGAHAANYKLGECVAVIGAGLIGQFSARWAYASGTSKVIVVDPAGERLRFLRNAGHFITIDRGIGEDVYAQLSDLCGGKLPDVVVESTGCAAVFQHALKAAGPFGRVVLMSDTGTPEEQRLCGEVITRGLTIVGVHDPQDRPEWNEEIIAPLFFQMCLDRRIVVDGMVTHRFRPENPEEIYRVCCEERNHVMGMIVNWEEGQK